MLGAFNQEKAIIVKSSRRFVWSSSVEVWGRWSPRRATAGCWVDQGSYNITTSSQHHHQQQHCSGAPRWWGQEEKELVTRKQWQLFVWSPPLLRPTLAGVDIFTSTLLAGGDKNCLNGWHQWPALRCSLGTSSSIFSARQYLVSDHFILSTLSISPPPPLPGPSSHRVDYGQAVNLSNSSVIAL